MNGALGNHRLCMETRMLAGAGTGVMTYARALQTAQSSLSEQALTLSGGDVSSPGSPQSLLDRITRALRSAVPLDVSTRVTPSGFVRHDVFRLAHAYFTLHGALLTVRVPGPPGIMHWSYPLPLRLSGWDNVYTVHDLIPLTDPELTPIDGARHRRLLQQITRSAAAIVTVSEAAARTIESELDAAALRVVNCSQPVTVQQDQTLDPILPVGLVRNQYLLVCGLIEPRKNIARILAAYRASGSSLPLVISGPDGWEAATIAAALQNTVGVVRLPYQTRAVTLALLKHARAVLMPSLAEGFGLPVAEAMALGTPVITSNIGALAETAGGAALLVDPYNVDEIMEAIRKVQHDSMVCQTLSAAGQARAAAFAPDRFVEQLRTLYDDIAQHHMAGNLRPLCIQQHKVAFKVSLARGQRR